MKIIIHAKPLSREERVEEMSDGELVVAVREPPVKGLANRAIVCVLARHFGVPQNHVRLLAGFSSRRKVFEITD